MCENRLNTAIINHSAQVWNRRGLRRGRRFGLEKQLEVNK